MTPEQIVILDLLERIKVLEWHCDAQARALNRVRSSSLIRGKRACFFWRWAAAPVRPALAKVETVRVLCIIPDGQEIKMGENSKIEWTTHTFNPWWGCTKVSEACKHCYAEAWAKRVGQEVWGPKADRRMFGDAHWAGPIQWNKAAGAGGPRPRVFCASMADVFEDRDELNRERAKLWPLIEATPNLDWLLLTKRPQNVNRLAGWGSDWPSNVWLGTTVELQARAEELLPHLASVPAAVRFISAEPLLGPLSLEPWLGSKINWVITGGESGPKARPASPAWFRSILSQCITGEVPFHFKQWGDWVPNSLIDLSERKSLRREIAHDGTPMVRVGKKIAGRVLDGAHWDGLPERKAA